MSETWVQDRIAINYLEKVVISLEWMWREQPLLDRGIDGHIEICEKGKPTGKLIAVQSKGGESYFYRSRDENLTLSLKLKHLSYWNEFALPVIVIGYLPSEQVSYWVYIQEYMDRNPDLLNLKQDTVSVPIPSTNLFNIESKQLLFSICDAYIERTVRLVFENRNLDMTIIEQLESIATKSSIDPNNFEMTVLSRILEVGAPLEKSVALLAQGQNKEAREPLESLITDTEKYLANQYAWLAGSFLQESNYEAAKKFSDKSIAINPNDFYALNIRGVCYAQAGDLNNAEQDFQKALEISPNFAAPFVNKGKALMDARKYQEAINMFDEGIRRFPNKVEVLRMKGDCHKHLQEYPQAISSYNEALQLNNKDADAWKGLGDIFGYQEKFDMSVDAYTKAIESDPHYLIALSNRGFAKYHKGDRNGARNDFDQVLRVDPNNEHALKGLMRLNGAQ
jgi:tetratricopeptide (TPR) repeat protein